MGDPPRSTEITPAAATSYYNALGLPISASLKDICKAYKSLAMIWHPDRNRSNKEEAQAKFSSINEAYRVLSLSKKEEAPCNEQPKTPKNIYNSDCDGFIISNPTLISTTSTRISLPTTPASTSTNSNGNGTGTPPNPSTPTTDGASFAKMASKRTAPIIYSHSNSTPRTKLPPVEKKLVCTLEELCHGAVKSVKINREVVSHFSVIVQEEETLSIDVKPGWKKGTKITFEGKGDERPGFLPADIIFVIDEKRHRLFKRRKNDLELGVEIPLVQALTGCTISVPLLGGDDMTLTIDDDIIYPGYEKIIPDQGMPKPKGNSGRGDLCLKFLVAFPSNLSDEQRSEIVDILEEVS
ncbi:hypothetical protein Leryth_007226 [Lithospermum erythrorhizon]|nr:hypothetical protein Leryth_007226 [Lithospermum erythrorhizon]